MVALFLCFLPAASFSMELESSQPYCDVKASFNKQTDLEMLGFFGGFAGGLLAGLMGCSRPEFSSGKKLVVVGGGAGLAVIGSNLLNEAGNKVQENWTAKRMLSVGSMGIWGFGTGLITVLGLVFINRNDNSGSNS